MVCGLGGILVICDGLKKEGRKPCGNGCHLECATPELKDGVPDGDWFCSCVKTKKPTPSNGNAKPKGGKDGKNGKNGNDGL
jgi:hypothetical protein